MNCHSRCNPMNRIENLRAFDPVSMKYPRVFVCIWRLYGWCGSFSHGRHGRCVPTGSLLLRPCTCNITKGAGLRAVCTLFLLSCFSLLPVLLCLRSPLTPLLLLWLPFLLFSCAGQDSTLSVYMPWPSPHPPISRVLRMWCQPRAFSCCSAVASANLPSFLPPSSSWQAYRVKCEPSWHASWRCILEPPRRGLASSQLRHLLFLCVFSLPPTTTQHKSHSPTSNY